LLGRPWIINGEVPSAWVQHGYVEGLFLAKKVNLRVYDNAAPLKRKLVDQFILPPGAVRNAACQEYSDFVHI
jgi:hypothetical protein